MYCKNCKKEIEDNATICPYCQTQTDILLNENAQEQENPVAPEVTNDNTASDEVKIENTQNADEIADNASSENAYYSSSTQTDDTVSQNIQPAYNFVDDNNEDEKKKKKIIFAVIAVAVIALFFAFKDSILPFSGTYENISSGTTWQFSGNTFVETIDGDTYTGTFTKDGNRIILTEDDDGTGVVFVKKGNYIYREDSASEENFNISSGYVNQNLTFYTDLSDDSSDLYNTYLTLQYSLEDDGSYAQYMTAGINSKSKTILSGTGTYCVEGDFLVFYDDENTNTNKYLIDDNHVYNSVCEKQ